MNQFVTVMNALSDPSRVKIVKMLEHRSMCVCATHTALKMAQPVFSNHLKVLENIGFVISRKCGLWVNYSLSNGAMLLGALKHGFQSDSEIVARIANLRNIHRETVSQK